MLCLLREGERVYLLNESIILGLNSQVFALGWAILGGLLGSIVAVIS